MALRVPTAVVSPHPPTLLQWSPTGAHILAALDGDCFAVWETTKWAAAEVFDFPGICRGACWSPDGGHLALVVDAVSPQDKVWVDLDGAWGSWRAATVVEVESAGPRGRVRVVMDPESGQPEGGQEVVALSQVHGDKPVVVGTVFARPDTSEFDVKFETAFLPALDEVADLDGAMQLPSSAIASLAWGADGGTFLASYAVVGAGEGIGAVAAFTVSLTRP